MYCHVQDYHVEVKSIYVAMLVIKGSVTTRAPATCARSLQKLPINRLCCIFTKFLNGQFTKLLLVISIPVDPNTTQLAFIPSANPRDTEPPEVFLSFTVSVLPPTNVTCQLNETSVAISSLSREVFSKELDTSAGGESPSPATNVTVTIKTRQAGDYQCNIFVFKTSESDYMHLQTTPIHITGWIQLYTLAL